MNIIEVITGVISRSFHLECVKKTSLTRADDMKPSRRRLSLKMSYATIAVLLAFACTSVVPPANGVRVLAVEVVAGKSHWNVMSAVLRALTDGGHRVTVFTSFPDGDRDNYTEVDVSADFPRRLDANAAAMVGKFGDPVATLRITARMSRSYCDTIHRNGRFRALLESADRGPTGFDVVVVEPLWLDCMSHVAAELDVPLVYVMPSPMVTFLERPFLGHVSNPAAVSHVMARHAVPDTFVRRLTNAALLAYSAFVFAYSDSWYKYTEPKPYDGRPTVAPSAVFVNSHFVTEPSRPVTPNVVEVGGIHLNQPKPIPNVLGIIYFSDRIKDFTMTTITKYRFIYQLFIVFQAVKFNTLLSLKQIVFADLDISN